MSEIISEYAVPAIMAGVYLILLMAKPLFGENTKWIPLAAGILGIGLNAWMNMGGIVKDVTRNANGDATSVTVLESSYYSYNKKDWRCGKTYSYNAKTGKLTKSGYTFQGYLLNPNVEPDPVDNQLKVGDAVTIVASGNSRKDGKGKTSYGIGFNRYILAIYPTYKYPYRVGSAKGVTTGYYTADALSKGGSSAPVSDQLEVGDHVKIVASGNSRKDGKGKTSGGIGWERYVLGISASYKYPYRIGTKNGITTGYYKASALKKI